MQAMRPAPVSSASVTALNVVGEQFRPLVTTEAFEIFDVRGPAETGPPPHRHPWNEAYFVLEGALEVQRDDERVRLEAGDSVHVPPMTLHAYRVLTAEARFVTVTSPGGAAAFFTDVDASVASADDLPALVAAARRNQVTSPLFPE
jgi:quercetin dioxygenase-like cupin family protein